jgi:hypothetical protein
VAGDRGGVLVLDGDVAGVRFVEEGGGGRVIRKSVVLTITG